MYAYLYGVLSGGTKSNSFGFANFSAAFFSVSSSFSYSRTSLLPTELSCSLSSSVVSVSVSVVVVAASFVFSSSLPSSFVTTNCCCCLSPLSSSEVSVPPTSFSISFGLATATGTSSSFSSSLGAALSAALDELLLKEYFKFRLLYEAASNLVSTGNGDHPNKSVA